ncbi:MAG: type II toxin-antitoxin system HicB family antitoxin [Candidatus Adiutrix sp.]|jgi:predicted RNase H-like HicB family nuclease|nr:type II toxin-antitoxin system HicB family antitoxin [Candidatus Adiutrix sp.]
MKYVYPAVLYPDHGRVGVRVPDLPGCFTFGADQAEALLMARDAVEMWLWDAENRPEAIPPASAALKIKAGETLTLVAADTDEYRRANDSRSVRKTLSLDIRN